MRSRQRFRTDTTLIVYSLIIVFFSNSHDHPEASIRQPTNPAFHHNDASSTFFSGSHHRIRRDECGPYRLFICYAYEHLADGGTEMPEWVKLLCPACQAPICKEADIGKTRDQRLMVNDACRPNFCTAGYKVESGAPDCILPVTINDGKDKILFPFNLCTREMLASRECEEKTWSNKSYATSGVSLTNQYFVQCDAGFIVPSVIIEAIAKSKSQDKPPASTCIPSLQKAAEYAVDDLSPFTKYPYDVLNFKDITYCAKGGRPQGGDCAPLPICGKNGKKPISQFPDEFATAPDCDTPCEYKFGAATYENCVILDISNPGGIVPYFTARRALSGPYATFMDEPDNLMLGAVTSIEGSTAAPNVPETSDTATYNSTKGRPDAASFPQNEKEILPFSPENEKNDRVRRQDYIPVKIQYPRCINVAGLAVASQNLTMKIVPFWGEDLQRVNGDQFLNCDTNIFVQFRNGNTSGLAIDPPPCEGANDTYWVYMQNGELARYTFTIPKDKGLIRSAATVNKAVTVVHNELRGVIVAWGHGIFFMIPGKGVAPIQTVLLHGPTRTCRHCNVVDLLYDPKDQVLSLLLGNAAVVTYKCLLKNGDFDFVPLRWVKNPYLYHAEAFIPARALGNLVFGYARGINPYQRNAISVALYDAKNERLVFASVKDYQKTFDFHPRFFGISIEATSPFKGYVITCSYGESNQATSIYREFIHYSWQLKGPIIQQHVRKMATHHLEAQGLTLIAVLGSAATFLIYDPSTETLVNANVHTFAIEYYDCAFLKPIDEPTKKRPWVDLKFILIGNDGFEVLNLRIQGWKYQATPRARVSYFPTIFITERIDCRDLFSSGNFHNMQLYAANMYERAERIVFWVEKSLQEEQTTYYQGELIFRWVNESMGFHNAMRKTILTGNHMDERMQISYLSGLPFGGQITQDVRDKHNKLSQLLRFTGAEWVDRRYEFFGADVTITDETDYFIITMTHPRRGLPCLADAKKVNAHILYRRPDEYCWVSLRNPNVFKHCFDERQAYQDFRAPFHADKRPILLHKKFGLDKVIALIDNQGMAYGENGLHIMRMCPCLGKRRQE